MTTLVNRPHDPHARITSACDERATLFVPRGGALGIGVWLSSSVALAQDGDPTRIAALPRDLSVWGMFTSADTVVQVVMIGLLLASIATWTIAFAKSIELVRARRRLAESTAALARARGLAEARDALDRDDTAGGFVAAATSELDLSHDVDDAVGIKERVASRLARLEAALGRRLSRGTGVLATIGATAPFVGLFGTVWGIMNSFIGISKQQTTNLAVVAPGIAEALLATGTGLVAAIPAVVIYNALARAITAHRAAAADASAEVQRLVGRDLDRAATGREPGRALRAAAE